MKPASIAFIISTLVFAVVVFTTKDNKANISVNVIKKQQAQVQTCEELNKTWFELPDASLVIDRPESEQSKEDMVEEVVMLWEIFFEDAGTRKTDKRRDRFTEFAEYIVDYVVMFQDAPTDIGGQLPRHKNVHLLIATMVTFESSITPNLVGKKGEVGLMQIMPNGPAIAGYNPVLVQNNPKLGLFLGIRFLASVTQSCKRVNLLNEEWGDYDWLGPLSLYGGGGKAKNKDGTCKAYTVSRERIDRTVMYRARIDNMENHEI